MSKKQMWENLGEENPYFGVYTVDKFRTENLDDEKLGEFFESGEIYVREIWEEIEDHFKADFNPKKALDFGCGVGRLTLPLASKCQTVTGVDISSNMLKEAEKNAVSANISNVGFKESKQFFSGSSKEYDFVHSFIVFQHIKPKEGEKIFAEVVKMLKTGGIGVLHLTYFNGLKRKNKITNAVYRNFPVINRFRNFVLRSNATFIPVYTYNLNTIYKILQENNCHKIYTRFTYHGFDGIVMFFQKKEGLL